MRHLFSRDRGTRLASRRQTSKPRRNRLRRMLVESLEERRVLATLGFDMDFQATAGNQVFVDSSNTLGYFFSTNRTIVIEGLAIFDNDGLTNVHQTRLWTSTGTELASVNLDSNDQVFGSPRTGGSWRFESINPLELAPGNYVIGAHYPGTGQRDAFVRQPDPAHISFAQGITFQQDLAKAGNTFPNSSDPTVSLGFFGPSFIIQDPVVANTPPTISDIGDQTATFGQLSDSIGFNIGDTETDPAALVVSASSSNPTLIPDGGFVFGGGGANRSIQFTPTDGQTGTAEITVTVTDGGNLTASDVFTVTVNAPNTAPTITDIANAITSFNTATPALEFTVGDVETSAAALVVTGTSSDQTLVPDANVVFGGSGADRTVTVTPADGQSGTVTIMVTVTDESGATTSDTFDLTINAANTAPTITDIADQQTPFATATGDLAFVLADDFTALGDLVVTASSNNLGLVPESGIVLGGSGANRTITITPAADQIGTATITITATDEANLSTVETFDVVVAAPPADFGDAPASYGVTLASGGALHRATGATLGPNRDIEADGQASDDGLADDRRSSFGAASQVALATVGLTSSVAIGDLNGDGIPDMVVSISNSDSLDVLIGNGDGTFGAATSVSVGAGVNPNFVVLDDFNGDTILDAVVQNSTSDDLSLLIGNGDGTFGAATIISLGTNPALVATGTNQVASGDVNGDGSLDLVVVGFISDDITVVLGNGDGTFSAPAQFPAFETTPGGALTIILADTDDDNDLDAVVANFFTEDVTVLSNDGSGVFGPGKQTLLDPTNPGANGTGTVAAGDFNGDGSLDLITANVATGVLNLLIGNKSDTFALQPPIAIVGATSLTTILAKDIDGDSNLDVVVTAQSGTVFVVLGNGDGTFQEATPLTQGLNPGNSPFRLALADLNGDGLDEIITDVGGGVAVFSRTPDDEDGVTFPDEPIGTTQLGSFTVDLQNADANSNLLDAWIDFNRDGDWDDVGEQVFAGFDLGTTNGPQTLNFVVPSTTVAGASFARFRVSTTGINTPGGFALDGEVEDHAVTLVAVPPNVDPTITDVANQTTLVGTATGPLAFTIADTETAVADLVVTVSSSDQTLVPDANIVVSGVGADRTVVVTPADGQTGTVTITVTVTDLVGATASDTFDLTVNAANTAPTITDIADQQTPFATATGDLAFVLADDFTALGDLVITASSNNLGLVPESGIVLGGSGANRTITITPAADQIGTATITITATDEANLSTVETFDVVVAAPPADFGDAPASYGVTLASGGALHRATGATLGPNRDIEADGQASDDGLADDQPSSFGAATQVTLATAGTTGSVAIGDLDGDGTPDMVVAISNPDSLDVLLGNGDGTFGAATSVSVGTGVNPNFVVLDDFNGDSILDAVVQNRTSDDLSLLIGNGDGTFAAATIISLGTNPASVATGTNQVASGDVNGDGDLDLVVVGFISDDVTVVLGNGDGTFAAPAQFPAFETTPGAALTVILTDIDDDNDLDAVVANFATDDVTVLLNDGSGVFGPGKQTLLDPSNANANGTGTVAAGDFDGDGSLDLVTANNITGVLNLLIGNKSDTFALQPPIAVAGAAGLTTILAKDINGDSKLDVVVTDQAGAVFVAFGNGDGTFQAANQLTQGLNPGDSPFRLALADLNSDGLDEIITDVGGAVAVFSRSPDDEDGVTFPAEPIGTTQLGSFTVNLQNADANSNLLDAWIDFNRDGDWDDIGEQVFAGFDLGTTNGPQTLNFVVPSTTVAGASFARFRVSTTGINTPGGLAIDGEVEDHAVTLVAVPPNANPTITDVANQTTTVATATEPIAFTIADTETAVADLVVTVSSSDQTLVPDANIVVSGVGANRTVVVTPADGQTGTATITVTVTDAVGATASDTFELSVTIAPTITDIADVGTQFETATQAIEFTIGDTETAVADLVVTVSSSDQTLVPDANIVVSGSGADRTVVVTPADGQSGTATITVTVTDTAGATASDTFELTVNASAAAPTISDIADLTTAFNTATPAIEFTIGDAETAVEDLVVTVSSSAQTLVPDANIVVSGSGADRTVVVTPANDQSGTATITITVTDENGETATDTFVLTVSGAANTAPTISDIANRSTTTSTATAPIPFTIGDAETAVGSLTVSFTSSNLTLVPVAGIVLGGTGANRTLLITPVTGQTGSTLVTVTVTDENNLTASEEFTLTVAAVLADPEIVISPTGPDGEPDPANLATGDQPTSWTRQRSSLREFVVTLPATRATAPPASSVRVTNLGINPDVDADQVIELRNDQLSLAADGVTLSITLDANQLTDGVYKIELLAEITGGETFTVSGNATNKLFVLRGDWNGDGGVNIRDFSTFAYWFGQATPTAPGYVDLNNSGGVNILDFSAFAANFGKSLTVTPGATAPTVMINAEGELNSALTTLLNPPDVNGDGSVTTGDALDVLAVLASDGSTTDDGWMRQDVNRDGNVTAGDALVVINRLLLEDNESSTVPIQSPLGATSSTAQPNLQVVAGTTTNATNATDVEPVVGVVQAVSAPAKVSSHTTAGSSPAPRNVVIDDIMREWDDEEDAEDSSVEIGF